MVAGSSRCRATLRRSRAEGQAARDGEPRRLLNAAVRLLHAGSWEACMGKSKWPFEEQTWLTVRHRTPGGMVLVEAPCGCCYQAARHFGAALLQPWARLLVLRVMDNGDLLVEDGRRRVHRLSGLGVERHCDRHLRELLFRRDE